MKNTITTDDRIKKYFDLWTSEFHRAEKSTKESIELAHVLNLIVDSSEVKLTKELNERVLSLLGR